VFRDRRRYEAPNSAPSDDSWSVRTQGYYGRRADLSEHEARTAEVEARTGYGSQVPNESAQTGRAFSPVSTQGLGAAGLDLRPHGGSGRFGDAASPNYGNNSGYASTPAGQGPVRFAHPNNHSLWDDSRILPHTGVVVSPDVPIGFGSSTRGIGSGTGRPQFSNGYNNGYSDGFAFQEQYSSPPPAVASPQRSPPRADSHIPGYSGVIRGSQFVHGDTFSKMSRQLLAVPTEVPLEP
jgi:hypothetical protein